jgi:rhomboid protease GluP
MRKRTGAVVCPHCGRLVDVNEAECPFCGRPAPGMFGYGPALQKWMGSFDLSLAIVGVCVILYILTLVIDPGAIFRMASLFDLLAPSTRALFVLGMTGGFALAEGRWWTLITAVFLHGSLLHLLFNMAIGRRYLQDVVTLYGNSRAWVIFFVAGVIGFAVSDFAAGVPTIGASGSIFGLLAALIVYGRRMHRAAVTQQLWMSALVMFVFGFFMPSVNNWAHAGGFAGGFVAAEAVSFAERRESPVLLAVAWGTALLVVVAFTLQLLRMLALLTPR